MTGSYRAQVGIAFEVLAEGLAPFVDRRMRKAMPEEEWILEAATKLGKRPDVLVSLSDPHFQLEVINRWWGPAFAPVLPASVRPVVTELRTARNHWAHPDESAPIDLDYAFRVHANCEELLRAVGAPEADRLTDLTDELRLASARAQARREGISETDALLTMLAELERERDELADRFEQASRAAETATGRSRAVSRQLAELQTQYAAVAGLRDRYRELQARLAAESRSRDAQEQDSTGVRSQLADAERALEALQTESTRLRDQLVETRRSIDQMNPAEIPAGRRWIWLTAVLILLLGVMVVVAYYAGRAAAAV